MNKNKELTENLYNACKNWLENFECPLDEWEKNVPTNALLFSLQAFTINKRERENLFRKQANLNGMV